MSPSLQRLTPDDRDARAEHARELVAVLGERGVTGFATSFVDNAGVSRVKTVPLDRLPHLAAWGVGFSTVFDYFGFDDGIAAPADGSGPVGDQRIIPDLARVVVLAGQPGWAWAPGDRWTQDGVAHAHDARLLLHRGVSGLRERGLEVRAALEIEWVVARDDGSPFTPAVAGSGYGLSRLVAASDYSRDLLRALAEQGVTVEQYHPEYGPGQFEVSVAAEAPVEAADTSVVVRATIRAVGERHGWRTSFSPKVDTAGVGNGGHVHLSLWRDGTNLMAGGPGPFGLTGEGEAFAAGVLDHLPALLAVGAPGVASYLRLVPQHWAGVYAAWGLENRETALRFVTGSTGSAAQAANLEVKCVDLQANPYLLLTGLLATGAAGLDAAATLPEPVDVDPAALGDDLLGTRGITRLPTTLADALAAFSADDVLRAAFGEALVGSITAVREAEIARFADARPEEVADAVRWVH